jgi:hypothetical protein
MSPSASKARGANRCCPVALMTSESVDRARERHPARRVRRLAAAQATGPPTPTPPAQSRTRRRLGPGAGLALPRALGSGCHLVPLRSSDPTVLQAPDNLTVGPCGGRSGNHHDLRRSHEFRWCNWIQTAVAASSTSGGGTTCHHRALADGALQHTEPAVGRAPPRCAPAWWPDAGGQCSDRARGPLHHTTPSVACGREPPPAHPAGRDRAGGAAHRPSATGRPSPSYRSVGEVHTGG